VLITRIKLKNWRNFRDVDVSLASRGFLIGANASGKSNLLDVFRFLRTIAQSDGGGLQKAIKERGGITKLRSLHARGDSEVRLEIELSPSANDVADAAASWRYVLAFKGGSKGRQQVSITEESVHQDGQQILLRPNDADRKDHARLTQTHLEQINNNAKFRSLVEYFAMTTYLHLVPQLLKHSDEISGRMIESDPFGQGLLQRIAKTPAKTRDARLRRIEAALKLAVPQFSELGFEQDALTGSPHLKAKFNHWRGHGSWQREDQFSDGTLRLLGLLWALQEGDGLLLLEEPELSLNNAITQQIPLMIDRVLRKRKSARQVLISTHSADLIKDVGEPTSVLLVEPGANGSTIRVPNSDEQQAMEHGLNAAEVMLVQTRPKADQLRFFP
jgi:predicted ATPase